MACGGGKIAMPKKKKRRRQTHAGSSPVKSGRQRSDAIGSSENKGTLAVTMTGEIYQPIRVHYDVFDVRN